MYIKKTPSCLQIPGLGSRFLMSYAAAAKHTHSSLGDLSLLATLLLSQFLAISKYARRILPTPWPLGSLNRRPAPTDASLTLP